jgi:hypothetical protein
MSEEGGEMNIGIALIIAGVVVVAVTIVALIQIVPRKER